MTGDKLAAFDAEHRAEIVEYVLACLPARLFRAPIDQLAVALRWTADALEAAGE